ncbi:MULTISPECIES: hypothetical protein [Anoxynatronum]|uniref:Uncharacterized protein n=2 Tax=Anoxynatronum TaxID=210622 RepID=A0AA46AKM7_9CLOT|nr:hypothetical protein [Anoxynatronum buryatiense]SMP71064.1 hypothetical protein SAMN06296020_1226 [Anoxynatronum buryatiense]
MYRILSESVNNYMNDPATEGARRKGMSPICLLVDARRYHEQRLQNTPLYHQTQELLCFLREASAENPRLETLLWHLESRRMLPPETIQLSDESRERCQEQVRILKQLISLAYWH